MRIWRDYLEWSSDLQSRAVFLVFSVIAIASMRVGNLLALQQTRSPAPSAVRNC